MTNNNFLSIALTLNSNRAPLPLVLDLADDFEDIDPLFDRRRFLDEATVNMRDDAKTLDFELKN